MIDTAKLRELAQATIRRREAGFECDDHYDTYPEDLFAASTIPEYILDLLDRLEAAERDAKRYQYLRGRDLDAIVDGGIFVGKVPDNIVMNEDYLDSAVDHAMQQEAGE